MSDLLQSLRAILSDNIKGIRVLDEGLEALIDLRYGETPLRIELEPEADSLRVFMRFAPPAGAGPDFLLFCLALNTQYWDVKVGLEEDGVFVVHSDLDLDDDVEDMAQKIVDRLESMYDLFDGDLVTWLERNKLGTPAQVERWNTRRPN